MAYSFVRTSSQDFTASISDIPVPLTIAAWFNRDATTSIGTVVALDNTGNSQYQVVFQNGGSVTIVAQTSDGNLSAQSSNSAGNVVAGTWFQSAGRYASVANRRVFLDAVEGSGSFTSRTAVINQLHIGGRSGTGQFWGGELAEVAVWDVDLTAAEITSLAKGFKPSRIRPQSLVYYVPLVRNVQELRSGLTLTASASSPTVANHMRVY